MSTPPLAPVTISGWVRTVRNSKHVAFVTINDGSTLNGLQLVADANSAAFKLCGNLTTGSAIRATGLLTQSPGKGQSFEINLHDLEILGDCPNDYPLQKKGHTLEFLREIAHLRPRSNTFGAVFRIRSTLAQAIHRFFAERQFYWAHTPIITASDCEGAGEQFTVTTLNFDKPADFKRDFFATHAKLAVSGQLEAEFLAMGLSRVYTFGPTFRAENSNTTRHLAEFWMVEPEVAFADLNTIMTLAADFVQYLCAAAVEHCSEDIAFLAKFYKNTSLAALETLASAPVTRMSYTDAITTLQKASQQFTYEPKWGADLQTEHERYLSEQVCKGPVLVHDYPKDIKSFYMRCNEDDHTVAAMDLLVPGVGELIGGSQREEREDILRERMTAMGIPTDALSWYLDLRRFGTAPHAGFGLGFERLLMFVTGMSNIRDVVMCPRAPGQIWP